MINLNIPEEAWEETGPDDLPAARLSYEMKINDVMMFVEAYEVIEGERNNSGFIPLISICSEFSEAVELFHRAADSDGNFMTTMIRGKIYIIVAYPYTE